MAERLWDGYSDVNFRGIYSTSNPVFQGNADAILARIDANGFAAPQQALIVGHSWGGAACFYLEKLLRARQPGLPTRIIAFGGPKPGGIDIDRDSSPDTTVRWMNVNDPVPGLPYPASALLNWTSIKRNILLARFNRMTQPRGGRNIDDLGNITPGVQPPQLTNQQILDFGAWVWAYSQSRVGPHSIAEYRRRLELYVFNHPTPADDSVAGGDWGVEENVPLLEAQRQQAAAVQNVFNREVGRAEADIRIPGPTLFTAHKNGRVWSVRFGGQLIAYGPTKRRARSMVRFGNEFLHRVQAQGVVDTAGLAAQFGAYLEAAEDPNGLFVPPINALVPR
jgi:pimeloyl-ACP methyl ester carboxylesterase